MLQSPRPLRDGSIAAALGVTRIARLTGLDRTGVEVASAIRPGAHVLQVTNGKGLRAEDARAGALLEAAELYAAERPVMETWDSAAALARRFGADAVLSPASLDPAAAEDGWDELRLAWRSGVALGSGAPVLVPAHAVHCPPAGGALLGPALVRWTSNGMGAHPQRAAALLHALLEAVERDALARALPDGFTESEVHSRLIERGSVGRLAPRAALVAARIEAEGMRVFFLDVSTSTSPGLAGSPARPALPCAAALIVDHEHGPVPLAAGYACRLARADALTAALLEAAQSRATEIHGAREDVAAGDRRGAAPLAAWLTSATARRDARSLPHLGVRSAAAAVRAAIGALARSGVTRAVAVDLAGPPGVHVVKVLAGGLLLSELL
jgi:ribosomal protein S12 methylthiotransferase accessory factor